MMFQALVFLGFLATGLSQVHNVDDHCKHDCSRYRESKVCGSDYKTYTNPCEFSIAACYYHESHRGYLTIIRRSACPASFTTAAPVDHCNDLCNEDVMHVCGSDGVVYDNKCKFTRAQCEAAKMNQTLFVVAKGDVCPQRRTPDCTQFDIDTSDLAIETGSSYTPRCSSHREYICAADGKTYSNECYLCSYMKTNNVKLEIVSDDICHH